MAAGWGGMGSRPLPSGGGSPLGGPRGGGQAVAAGVAANNDNNDMDDEWGWRLQNKSVHPVPSFYPMDPRSTRKVYLESTHPNQGGMEEKTSAQLPHSIEEVSLRISTACQSLSVHGLWDNHSPTATLSSMERVEMEINLYLGDAPSSQQQQVLLVELQRRKGCAITFHNYRRCLLDAAEGKFDPQAFNQTDGLDKPAGRDRCNQPRASLGRPGLARPGLSRGGSGGRPASIARPGLARPGISRPPLGAPLSPPASPSLSRPAGIMRPTLSPPSTPGMNRPSLRSPSFSADDAGMPIAGLKTEGESPGAYKESSSMSKLDAHNDVVDKALKALNMAASLIRKDRVDAKRLGMESLVLLTDPLRAGLATAKIASRVVLLGTARDEDAMALELTLAGSKDEDVDALFDESAGLGIRETILEMIMSDEDDGSLDGDSNDGFEGIEKEFTDSLFQLCLTVLSNALHTIEGSVNDDSGSSGAHQGKRGSNNEDDSKPSTDDSSSPRRRAATEPALPLSKRFIDDTQNAFGVDVLSSLIRILGQARTNPHDAYHSARCLGVLFKGCGNSHKARARRDLDAKRIVAAALEVGSRSHAKLADASRVAMMALVTDDEDSDGGDEGGNGTETMQNQEEESDEEEVQMLRTELPILESMSADSDESR